MKADKAESRSFDPRPLNTITETADYLRCSRQTVYKMIAAGKLKTSRAVGTRQRVLGESIVQHIAGQA